MALGDGATTTSTIAGGIGVTIGDAVVAFNKTNVFLPLITSKQAARGSGSGIDWNNLVAHQLEEWGAKYHKAGCGKPIYDLFICDKAINSLEFFKEGG